MEDENSFFDQTRRMSKNWTGRERSADEMLSDFRLFGHAKRADMLDQIDAEFGRMSPGSDEVSLKKYSEFTGFRRDMQDLHHRLRKAGR